MDCEEFEKFRDSLCEAAIHIVAEEGLRALTLRRLATEAGCSRQTPYRYFRSKDELIEEVFVRCHQVFIRYCEDAVEGVESPRAKLRNIRDVYLRFYRDEAEVYRVMSAGKPETPMPRVMELAAYEHMRLRSFFEEANEEGFVSGDPAAMAYLFWSAIDGLAKLQSEEQVEGGLDTEKISQLIEDTYFPAGSEAVALSGRE